MPAIKSISYKSRGFGGLLGYMHRSDSEELLSYIHRENSTTFEFTYLHNIFGIEPHDLTGIEQAFDENDRYRKQRANGNQKYQDIISFSPKDRAFLIEHPEALWNIVELYVEHRAPNSLAVARVHSDKEHVHVHIMISANEVKSSKATHLTKEQFAKTKELVEEYQRIHYPQLTASRINHMPFQTRRESSNKTLTEIVKEVLYSSLTMQEFKAGLEQQGIETYQYRDVTTGILIDGKKSRFTKLLNTKNDQEIADKLVQLKQSEKEPIASAMITDTVKEIKPAKENDLQALRRKVAEREQEQEPNQPPADKPVIGLDTNFNQSTLNELALLREQARERFHDSEREVDD